MRCSPSPSWSRRAATERARCSTCSASCASIRKIPGAVSPRSAWRAWRSSSRTVRSPARCSSWRVARPRSSDVELRNQIAYFGNRCASAAVSTTTAVAPAAAPAAPMASRARSAPAAPTVNRHPSATPTAAAPRQATASRGTTSRRRRPLREVAKAPVRRRQRQSRSDARRKRSHARAPRTAPRRTATAPTRTATRTATRYTVQLAAYDTRVQADALVKRLAARGVQGARERLEQAVPRAARPARLAQGRRCRSGGAAQARHRRLRGGGGRARGGAYAVTAPVATPLMQQYREIKARHQNAILFFRMGDFYEMFYEDAETASRVLGLTLTSRNNGGAAEVPLAGVPVKAGADYLRRLVQQGYRVAICEQVEDPKRRQGHRAARGGRDGHARRGVRRRPARRRAQQLHRRARAASHATGEREHRRRGGRRLDRRAAAVHRRRRPSWTPLLARLAPRELLVARGERGRRRVAAIARRRARHRARRVGVRRGARRARSWRGSSACASLDGLGIERGRWRRGRRGGRAAALPARAAAGGRAASRAAGGRARGRRDAARRDDAAQPRAGRVAARRRHARARCSPCSIAPTTPMGARLLRQWLLAPLADRAAIDARLDAVAALRRRRDRARGAARRARRRARRGAARRQGRGRPRDTARARARSATRSRGCPTVAARAPTGCDARASLGRAARGSGTTAPSWRRRCARRSSSGRRCDRRRGDDRARASTPSSTSCARCATAARTRSRAIQAEERARTGIPSLKVGFNKVFGYYIEVTNANLRARAGRLPAPADAHRRRALRHARAQGVRGEGADGRASGSRRASASCSRRCARASGAAIARLQCVGARSSPSSTCWRRSPTSRRARATCGPTIDRRLRPRDRGGPASGGRADDAARQVHPERRAAHRATRAMIILTGPNMAGK